jgi:hypothetical protein
MASTIQTVLTRLLQVAPIPTVEKEELLAVVDAAFVAAPAVATAVEDVVPVVKEAVAAVPGVVETVKTDATTGVEKLIADGFADIKNALVGLLTPPSAPPAPPS